MELQPYISTFEEIIQGMCEKRYVPKLRVIVILPLDPNSFTLGTAPLETHPRHPVGLSGSASALPQLQSVTFYFYFSSWVYLKNHISLR